MKDQRIVDRGVRLGLKHSAAMRQRVAHRAVHLRDAAQRVGILHAAAVAVRLADLAAFQHAPQVGRGLHLSGVRTRLVNALVKCRVGPFERVAAQAAEHVGGIHQCFRRKQRQRAHSQHGLRAIDQRDGFLGFQYQRLDLRPLQRLRAGNAHAFLVEALAFADQRQRQMRQRSQIAARAHASLRRHNRSDAAVEHLAERVDDDGPHAGVALGERVGPQQHHGARFRDGQRLAHADRVRAHQVDLQFANLVAGDAHVAQFADAGGDGIGDLVAGDDLVDDGARPVDRLARVGSEKHGAALDRHFAHRFERQIVSVDVECVQEGSP